ncbi:MAG: hypothetical protein P8Y99_12555 [Calditrichaceae bacterium]|jgi:hypothetical protein
MEIYNINAKTNIFSVSESNTANHYQESFVFMDEAEYEFFEERTAIMEYEGGLTRKKAEQLTYNKILQNRMIYSQAS